MIKKIYKIIILISFFALSFMKIANAECNFRIDLGENIQKINNFVDIDADDDSILQKYFIQSLDICPNENLGEEIYISYTFIENELATIQILVNNDKNNTASNKLLLMNYAKQTYGDFDTGQNPKIYNYFNSWKNNNRLVIYKRMRNQFNIIDEELFITNEKYNNKMKIIKAMIEKGEIKG